MIGAKQIIVCSVNCI